MICGREMQVLGLIGDGDATLHALQRAADSPLHRVRERDLEILKAVLLLGKGLEGFVGIGWGMSGD